MADTAVGNVPQDLTLAEVCSNCLGVGFITGGNTEGEHRIIIIFSIHMI